ncbi:MAG TPA: hypothetical protein VJV78_32915 [Polyangiales bacterium]|nr:hypothetical protein [Polyangiales bacterium]
MIVGAISWLGLPASAQEISLNAFGDVNYGYRFGDPADEEDAELFETFGEDIHPKSSHSGFGLVGTDFVLTAELPADFVYLGEINFQVERGQQSEFEVDVERMFLEKRFVPQFNLQAGLFFTPIGYFNRTLYSRAFLMVSAQVPDLFEEELGLIPTHTVGLMAHGQFSLPAMHRLQYMVSFGNGRGSDPVSNVYARDDDGWRSVTVMAEWWMPWANEMRFGVSGWFDKIETWRVSQMGEVNDITDDTTQRLKLRELGVDVHFVLKTKWVNVMLEGVYQQHHDLKDRLPQDERDTHLLGGIAEVSLNVGPEGAIKPYVRFDYVDLPDDAGPYLGLRREDDEITRVYVAEDQLGMLGVAWDAATPLRLKLEYSLALTGPRETNSVVAQAAFAF